VLVHSSSGALTFGVPFSKNGVRDHHANAMPTQAEARAELVASECF
jgi:hypothetical protein